MNSSKLIAIATVGIIVAAPVALAVIPTSFLESTPTLCLWQRLFGVRCLGCGLTRAASAAMHGQFGQAIDYNPLAVIVLPAFAVLAAGLLCRALRTLGVPMGRLEKPTPGE